MATSMILAVCCLAFAVASNAFLFSSEQRVIVKGILMCGDNPVGNVLVRLYDIDTVRDDLMGEQRTNDYGEFSIDGKTKEMTTIEPMLKIDHRCHESTPCDRQIRIDIPSQYIGKSGQTPKTLDIGTWNLMQYYKNEVRV